MKRVTIQKTAWSVRWGSGSGSDLSCSFIRLSASSAMLCRPVILRWHGPSICARNHIDSAREETLGEGGDEGDLDEQTDERFACGELCVRISKSDARVEEPSPMEATHG